MASLGVTCSSLPIAQAQPDDPSISELQSQPMETKSHVDIAREGEGPHRKAEAIDTVATEAKLKVPYTEWGRRSLATQIATAFAPVVAKTVPAARG
eukprot:460136-Alexandrium_andersonii.AAC.1